VYSVSGPVTEGMQKLFLVLPLLTLMTCKPPEVITHLDGKEISPQHLDTLIQGLVDRAGVTGLTVITLDGDSVSFRRAYGLANVETGESLRTDHIFYGASLSKSVFGYLVATLVEDGILDLDRPLQSYLEIPIPEIPVKEARRRLGDLAGDDRYQQLTARMCMAHTTGFPNWRFLTDEGYSPNGKLYFKFDPGERYSYSGEGMMLLQWVIELITGQDLETLAQDRVFAPLGMTMTSYVWQDKFAGKYCLGHTGEEKIIPKKTRDTPGAAGTMETTPAEYASFMQHVMRLAQMGHPVSETLFQPNVRIRSKMQFGPLARVDDDALASIDLSYTLGWGRLSSPHGFGYFKEGHDEGFQHYSILFPEAGKGVLLMSNSDRAESIFKYLLEATIGDVYTPWRWENYVPFDQPTSGLLPVE
jgi:CubicO group peptidase (beta-lactamase class C family)